MTLPADIVNAAGSWTQTGVGPQTFTYMGQNFEYSYAPDKVITFLEWGSGVIRLKEEHGSPVTSTFTFAWNGTNFAEENSLTAWAWTPPQNFHPVGAYPPNANISNEVMTAQGGNFDLITFDLLGNQRTPMPMTFDKFTNQLDIPGIFEKWSTDWKVYGRFQYRSYSGATNHPPLERFNVYEDQIQDLYLHNHSSGSIRKICKT